MTLTPRPFGAALLGLALVGTASAAEIKVSNDITTSTIWTSNNTYNLQKQVFVRPGASLTIQAGTIIASDTNVGGSLAVSRGAQIFVQGTAENPVIMTSKADVATWTKGDPRTGAWRESANEWGNLTVMGRAYISEDATPGNTKDPNPNNVAQMEGLTASFPGDPKVLYGGGNDDDDSGSISYLSLRYGGKVIALTNELNGLSLGGIGRGTDVSFIEIMNNVDDGIEIWGGTFNLRNFSIWNIGDDSLDIDQGYRGKIQFGLIVQGYSLDAKQGSGVGDNCCETDGAENSDHQPVTTTSIYNLTVIGQPTDGDGATAWRDNARVQYRNCIFMDCGEKVVRFDDKDGDGAQGYGYNGTLTWPQTWTTAYSSYSTVNAPAKPQDFYKAQSSGMLAEITDSVFFNNKDYKEADARGVFATANNNVKEPKLSPIKAITRSAATVKGGKVMQRVTSLDPRPEASALQAQGFAPKDGFYQQANYRGAFAPGNNWLTGWTAADAFGMLAGDTAHTDLGFALPGKLGNPVLSAAGPFTANSTLSVEVTNIPQSTGGVMLFGIGRVAAPVFGGTLVPDFFAVGGLIPVGTANGLISAKFPVPSFPSGTNFYWQVWLVDQSGPQGFVSTNAVLTRVK